MKCWSRALKPLVVGLLGAALVALPLVGSSASAQRAVTTYKVVFTVQDVDKTSLVKEVPGNGKTYKIYGTITAPAGEVGSANPAITLYTSGLGYGEWFWRFTAVRGYNYVQDAAEAGLTSLTIRKLGYGGGAKPDGFDLGYGTEATIDHQILGQLEDGDYTMDGHAGVTFSKVVLAGGTQSAFSVEEENETFHDASGIILAGFADEGFSPSLVAAYSVNVANCELDPQHQSGTGSPAGYAYREGTPAQFNASDLVDTAANVKKIADGLHTKDPCGYPALSVLDTLAENNLLGATIKVPVLSVFGAEDSEFIVPVATAFQKTEFALDKDHTVVTIPNEGQDLTLGTNHQAVFNTLTSWLCARDFGAGAGGSCS